MAKTLIASKLINKVVAQVDRGSFKKAKQEIYKVKKLMDKISKPIRMAKMQLDNQKKIISGVRQEARERQKMYKGIQQTTDKMKGGFNLDPKHSTKNRNIDYQEWWKTENKKQSDYTKLFDKAEQRQVQLRRKTFDERIKQEAAISKQKIANQIKEQRVADRQARVSARDKLRRGELAGVGTERFQNTFRGVGAKVSTREATQYTRRLSELNKQLSENTISASIYRTRLNQLNSDMRKHASNVKGLSDRYGKLRSTIVAGTAAFSGFSAVMSIAQATAAEQSIESMMRAVFMKEAPDQLSFLRKEAMRLGISFEESAKSFARFAFAAKAAGLSTEEANKQFTGITELSVIFGNTVDETSGVLKALEQMYSKTKVNYSLLG